MQVKGPETADYTQPGASCKCYNPGPESPPYVGKTRRFHKPPQSVSFPPLMAKKSPSKRPAKARAKSTPRRRVAATAHALGPLLERIARALERQAPSPVLPEDLSAADAFVWHAEEARLTPVPAV